MSGLTAAGSFLLADEIPVNEAGTSKKVTGTQMAQVFPTLISTVSGASATYAFSSIPATYRELEVRYYLRDSTATVGLSNSTVTLNADVGANYYYERLPIKGTTTTVPTEGLAQTGFLIAHVGGGSTANLHAAGYLRIPGYKGAGLKSFISQTFAPTATTTGNQNIFLDGGWWNNVAAITSITFTPTTGYDANSYAELWVTA